MVAEVDLHMHTLASDGRLTPSELIGLVAQTGLKVVSISDHDSTEGLLEAYETAKSHPDLTIIPGIELSTDIPGDEIHMLGYFMNYKDESFQHTLSIFREGRLERGRLMVEKLATLGIHIEWERVKEIAGEGSVGRPHIALAMVEKGYFKEPKGPFAEYLGRNGKAYVERAKMTPAEGVEILTNVGGVAVLAHPASLSELDYKVAELKEAGLQGILSYTEIIMGLPGETLESFKKGLEIIMSDKTVGTLNIYNCSLLPNAPMNEPWYREKYKIKTVSSPILLQHSSTHKRGIEEYEQIVTSTNTFTTQELKEMYILSWVVQTFHSFGIFEYIERYYENMNGLPIMKFYDSFLEYCRTQESIFSREYQKLIKHVDNGYSGKGWSHYDPQLGDIIWPFDEASFLRLVLDRTKLISEIENFINYFDHLHGFHTDHDILKDLVSFQVFLLTTRSDLEKIKSHDFNFNWKDFFVNNVELRSQPKTYFYKNLVTEQDPIQWCWLTAFIGRHEKYYKFHPDELSEKPIAELTSSV